MKSTTKALLGAAMSTLIAGAAQAADATTKPADAATSPAGEAVKGQCHGVNACKGKGECGGAGASCAGSNACKGKGWQHMTEADCKAKGGTFKAGAPAHR